MGRTINIQQGNAYTCDLIFNDKTDGVVIPYSLTGKTIRFTVKNPTDKSINDNKALIKKDWSIHSTEFDNRSKLELTKEETNMPKGEYVGDFKIDGENTEVCDVIVTTVVTRRG